VLDARRAAQLAQLTAVIDEVSSLRRAESESHTLLVGHKRALGEQEAVIAELHATVAELHAAAAASEAEAWKRANPLPGLYGSNAKAKARAGGGGVGGAGDVSAAALGRLAVLAERWEARAGAAQRAVDELLAGGGAAGGPSVAPSSWRNGEGLTLPEAWDREDSKGEGVGRGEGRGECRPASDAALPSPPSADRLLGLLPPEADLAAPAGAPAARDPRTTQRPLKPIERRGSGKLAAAAAGGGGRRSRSSGGIQLSSPSPFAGPGWPSAVAGAGRGISAEGKFREVAPVKLQVAQTKALAMLQALPDFPDLHRLKQPGLAAKGAKDRRNEGLY